MVPITLAASVFDAVDPAPATHVVSVASSEPADGTGDGDTAPDWAITGPLSLELRAERAGSGSGRLYAITVESRDSAGNTARKSVQVAVPRSARP